MILQPLGIILIASAYLIGAIPFGLIFVQCISHQDIRRIGSGNIGATNVKRAAGTSAALAVLGCDLIKGLAPVAASRLLISPAGHGSWIIAATALAAILGHMFPVYLKFKPSGKGVATTLGAFLILVPVASLAAWGVFIIFVVITRRVSVGSLTGTVSLVPLAWLTTHEAAYVVAAFLAATLIVIRHKDNIVRLKQGREPTLR